MSFVVYEFRNDKTFWLKSDNTWSDSFKNAKVFKQEKNAKDKSEKLKARYFPRERLAKVNQKNNDLDLFPIRNIEEKYEIDWSKMENSFCIVGINEKIGSDAFKAPMYK